jgi:DNA-binding SARP family transcriptional activator
MDHSPMNDGLEFKILGPLSVLAGGRGIALGGPRQRVILAMLVLAADRVVSVESLVEAVWGDRAPATVRTQVAICIAALRKSLKLEGTDDEVIVTIHPGYLLRVAGRHRVDALDFAELVAAAQVTVKAGDNEQAAGLLEEALGLWRGPALEGIPGFLIEDEAARLQEGKLSAYGDWVQLQLELGRHQALVSELAAVVREHPLRERQRHHLMLALYRTGRRAEAMEVFREGRRHFVEELGLEPGPELVDLHEAILQDAPELTLATPMADAPSVNVVPAQLPPGVPAFTGRDAELTMLDELLGERSDEMPPAVALITGVMGVGKTGLAVNWAHRAAEFFPDGQLFADLCGYDEHQESVSSSEVLGRFLRALGVPGEKIPTEPMEQAALFRSVLAGRRLLVLLDNVRSFSQIRDLLPANGQCCVVVTSRDHLDHLVAAHGTVLVRLNVLSEADSMELLAKMAGKSRIATDPSATRRLGELCDHLPLALRIAAARLASKPHWTVEHLVRRLADEERRLDELSQGALQIRASIGLSYRYLAPDVARMYRLLGLLKVPDFTTWVGAALLDIGLDDAENLLEHLVDAQLLDVVGTDRTGSLRYRFHNLLRLYAQERAEAEETATDLDDARDRALRTWLTLAEEAHRREHGGDYTIVHGTTPRRELAAGYVDDLLARPLDWIEDERRCLVAVIDHAARLGDDELVWDLVLCTSAAFATRNYLDDWRVCCERALAATRRGGNRRGEGIMLYELGSLELIQQRNEIAADLLVGALEILRAVGETHIEALTLRNLAILDRVSGDLGTAMDRLEQARPTLRAVGDRFSEAHVLSNMAQIELDRGRPDAAASLSLEAVRISSSVGVTSGTAQALNRLAWAYLGQNRLTVAEETFRRVLLIVRQKFYTEGEAHALLGMGETRRLRGRYIEAEMILQDALGVARRIEAPLVEGRILFALGEVCRMLGKTAAARRCLATAAELFERVGAVVWQQRTADAIAVFELADCEGGDFPHN